MVIPRLNMFCRWRFSLSSQVVDEENIFHLSRGRAAIKLVLQNLDLPLHSKVGMMIYNCDTVMNAIASTGHDIVFVDVTRELTIDMEHLAARAQDMQVLIVTHLFGIINDIAAIRARFPHLIIIEDCAHAMGCECGKEGDFAIWSLGRSKFFSIGEGGILQVNTLKYVDAIQCAVKVLPHSGWKTMLRQYLQINGRGILFSKWGYNLITKPLKRKSPREVRQTKIVPMRMSRLIWGWYLQDKPHLAEYVAQQLRNATIWKEYWQAKGVDCTYLHTQNGFMLPVWSEIKLPKVTGIETATHFAQCTRWARTFGYQGDCPCAEELLQHLTMLPCYYTLTEKQLKKQLYGK